MRSRKGLSTVVGTVFAIIALTSTVTYVSYSMGILDNYNQSVLTKNQQLSDVNKEKFQISSVTVPNNKLNITVVNTGNLPINFTKVWIQNTTATDWIRSSVPTSNFVAPGGVLKNIGQNSGVNINSAYSYNVKLVTSRGNSQQFLINSAGSQPLNIQLLAFPTTVPSGFKSELVMVVINNSTSTLINVSPNNPTLTINNVANDSPTCVSSNLTPTKYATISPGTTAIFTWDITVTGTGGDSCTASFTTPLNGGYAQTITSPAITPTAISLSATNYATNAGVITNDYTAFKWTQGNSWKTEWSFPGCATTDFQITIANNNQTAGGYKLWLSQNSQIFFMPTTIPPNNKITPTTYFLVNKTTLSPLGITSYNDYSYGIPNQGGIATLSFGADSPGDNQQTTHDCGPSPPNGLQHGTPYYGSIVLYGKFTKNSGDNSGGNYAQTIPFLAVIAN